MTPDINLTLEERKVRDRARSAAWYAVPENKAQRTTPEAKARAKVARVKYRALPKGKAQRATYEASPKGKAQRAAYAASPKSKTQRVAYAASPEGMAKRATYLAKPAIRARFIAYRAHIPIEIPNRPMPERCECCGEISAITLHFDHCHDSGRFRGWCCIRCNTGGGIADNPKLLRLRALYLERPLQPGPISWAYPKNRHRVSR
jgi:hypothetical protein